MYAIGIDSGTQGTKAVVVDVESGRVAGRGAAPHAMVAGLRPGESEQDPRVWIEAMEAAVAAAAREAGVPAREIACLGVSGQQHGFVPLDAEGRVLRPAKLWNDTSTVAETEALVAALGGPQAYIDKVGIGLAVGFTASKILWLKRREPESFAALRTVLLPHNYLNFHLTGRAHMEPGDASGTGLLDIRRRRWHEEAVAAVDEKLAGKLPALSPPSEPVGFVLPKVAARFGWGKVLVSAGGGDNMMGAIGTGNVVPGISTLSLGTSGTIYSYFAEPFSDPRGEIAAFCDSTGGWLPLLCTMNVTNATELFKGLFRIGNAELEALASGPKPGAGGLVFLPFVDGERVPALPEASGVFFGLTRDTFAPAPMARAVLEGTILNLGYGFARMRSLGLRPSGIRATGGGARSRLWLRIAADILGAPVVTLEEQEAAAFGAALQAIWTWGRENGRAAGIAEIAAGMVRTSERALEPDPANARAYALLQARFDSLWRALAPEFKRLPPATG